MPLASPYRMLTRFFSAALIAGTAAIATPLSVSAQSLGTVTIATHLDVDTLDPTQSRFLERYRQRIAHIRSGPRCATVLIPGPAQQIGKQVIVRGSIVLMAVSPWRPSGCPPGIAERRGPLAAIGIDLAPVKTGTAPWIRQQVIGRRNIAETRPGPIIGRV